MSDPTLSAELTAIDMADSLVTELARQGVTVLAVIARKSLMDILRDVRTEADRNAGFVDFETLAIRVTDNIHRAVGSHAYAQWLARDQPDNEPDSEADDEG
jgi:hypothetical protein